MRYHRQKMAFLYEQVSGVRKSRDKAASNYNNKSGFNPGEARNKRLKSQRAAEEKHERQKLATMASELKGRVGSEVGVEEFWKNFTGISREFHRNCMYL
jgi:hypothetical protein